MDLINQNDARWKHISLGPTNMTIGSSGCLLAALSNVYNLNRGYNEMNPTILNRDLLQNSGFTRDGLVVWSAVEKLWNCKVIFDNKKLDVNQFNIVRYNFLGGTHFTNLLNKYGDKAVIYDTWDDEVKCIEWGKITRVTTLIFPEETECKCCQIKY